MNDNWSVIFTNLVAEVATNKAEVQRIFNLRDISVAALSVMITDALGKLVISEQKLTKWQEMKPQPAAPATTVEQD